MQVTSSNVSSYPNSKKQRLYKSPYRIGRRVKGCFFYRRNQSTSLVCFTTCVVIRRSSWFNLPGCFSESTFLLNKKVKPIEENDRLETELHLANSNLYEPPLFTCKSPTQFILTLQPQSHQDSYSQLGLSQDNELCSSGKGETNYSSFTGHVWVITVYQ